MRLLTCRIEEQLFALRLEKCREMEYAQTLTAVPRAREYIAGIVNMRGDIITVFDLKAILGGEKRPVNEKYAIVRLRDEEQNIAILADQLEDVIDVDESNLQPIPSHFSELEARYITNIYLKDDQVTYLLDDSRLLTIGE